MKGDEEGLCDIRELQLVTNLLYEKSTPLEWFYPPIGKVASFAHRNFKAKIISKSDYESKRKSFLSKNPESKYEIPDYGGFMEAFFCAGVLPMTETEDFLKSLAESRNTLHGGKPLWVGYDTSVLRRSFFSNIIDFLKSHKLDNSVGHVVSGGVTEELMQGMDHKYKSHEVATLSKGFPEASSFFNQPGRNARLCRIGMADMKNMKGRRVFHTIKSKKGDLNIIRGYEEFEEGRNAEVVLFSADKNFVEMSIQKALRAHYVDYNNWKLQKHIENNPIPLNVVSRILYYGTMVFGMTRLSGSELYSIWSGKKVEDWDNGYIKAIMKGNLSIPFRKAHGVLKDMKKSGFIPKN